MLKVTDIVLDLLKTDELALEASRAGLLNLSAYAQKIHTQVENATKKPVQKGTIVVALSRIVKHLPNTPLLNPNIALTNLDIKSSLSVLTYKKSIDMQRKISVLNPFLLSMNDLFSMTEGPEKITIICSDKSKDEIKRNLGLEPKVEFNDLAAVTVSLTEEDVTKPNVVFTLLSTLATKRIQIIELVSTYTEISLIVKKEDMEAVFKALNMYFANKKI